MRIPTKIPARGPLLFLQDTLLKFLVVKGGKVGSRKKVIITRPDGIGDLILFSDALTGLRRLFPDNTHEITLVVSQQIGDLTQGLNGADKILPVNRIRFLTDPFYRWRFLRQIRQEGYDVALNPVNSRVAMLEDAIIRSTGAPVRVAWKGNLDNMTALAKRIADRCYTELFDGQDDSLMELERNAQFVRKLGLKDFEGALPKIRVPEAWLRSSAEILAAAGITGSYGILVPGTGPPPERSWPPRRYGDLAVRLLNLGLDHIVITGGEADAKLAEEVIACTRKDEVHNLAGKTSLGVLAGCMKGAKFVVGSDTGAVHLASALGVPTVCILGGAFPGRFFPYRSGKGLESPLSMDVDSAGAGPLVVTSREGCHCPRWNCSHIKWTGGTFPCILDVQVDDVVDGLIPLSFHQIGKDLSDEAL